MPCSEIPGGAEGRGGFAAGRDYQVFSGEVDLVGTGEKESFFRFAYSRNVLVEQ
jgi:hypothetical protein